MSRNAKGLIALVLVFPLLWALSGCGPTAPVAVSKDIRADATVSYGRLLLRAFAPNENSAKLDQTPYDDVRCYWNPGTYQLLGLEAGDTFKHPTGIQTVTSLTLVFSKAKMNLRVDEFPEPLYYTQTGVLSVFGTRPVNLADDLNPLPTIRSQAPASYVRGETYFATLHPFTVPFAGFVYDPAMGDNISGRDEWGCALPSPTVDVPIPTNSVVSFGDA